MWLFLVDNSMLTHLHEMQASQYFHFNISATFRLRFHHTFLPLLYGRKCQGSFTFCSTDYANALVIICPSA